MYKACKYVTNDDNISKGLMQVNEGCTNYFTNDNCMDEKNQRMRSKNGKRLTLK
jgi:hypothetical protein